MPIGSGSKPEHADPEQNSLPLPSISLLFAARFRHISVQKTSTAAHGSGGFGTVVSCILSTNAVVILKPFYGMGIDTAFALIGY
jgi:hypothetical protein